ncbi:Uu.00g108990.m01.CDS01 [Anthostomella pinea]|uniref:Uu.00g108990.m01.CDS01 n=1 Tax=Anthostomella pinea TaxID=933095 RepID=A0AAI8VEP7_9PEZI|nr:Uu.00g108990.m01.CDS01 [Anthostomella pinea]
MASYISVNPPFPYINHATPVPLPTYDEIVALGSQPSAQMNIPAGQVPGPTDRSIVKIGEHFVVKYGKGVDLIEGENMLTIRRLTNIPIPTLYAMCQHSNGDKVIIMEYVEGESLRNGWNGFTDLQKASMGAQLRSHLKELRNIPTDGYYGLPGGRPYLPQSWMFKHPAGPFATAALALRLRLQRLKAELVELSKGCDASVFTHADLQPQNILYFEFFMYRTYEMATWGLPAGSDDPILRFGPIVKKIFQVWQTYADLKKETQKEV